jgi:hypothetical protein
MEAVRQWKYAPTYLNDQPVPLPLERDGNVPAERVIGKESDGGRGKAIEVAPFLSEIISGGSS